MSWETRGNRKYYYRTKTINGRRHRLYIGSGKAAEDAAREDAQRRQRLAQARAHDAAQEARIAAAQLAAEELAAWTESLARAVMLLAGQHQHHGAWRRRVIFI